MSRDDIIVITNPIKLPHVGRLFNIEELEFKVTYRNESKKVFTAEPLNRDSKLPNIGLEFLVLPFRYEVVFVNQEKKRFNAEVAKIRFFPEDEEQI